jgi:hypothetical protein
MELDFMTLEQAAIAVCGVLSTFSLALLKIIWQRSVICEKWREEKEPLIQQMAEKLGFASGTAALVNECPTPGCPFAGRISASTYSLEKDKDKTHKRP